MLSDRSMSNVSKIVSISLLSNSFPQSNVIDLNGSTIFSVGGKSTDFLLTLLLLTLVSFVRVEYETKKPRVSTRGRNSFSDKKLLSIY